ncbi:unnamed protein product [Chrysoparadoxa australica]
MDSSSLHVAPQRFPTPVLRLELEAELEKLIREEVTGRERKNTYLQDDYSSDEDEPGDVDGWRRDKQARRKQRREQYLKEDGEISIYEARKRMLAGKKFSFAQKELARELAALGPGACIACLAKNCQRKPVVDVEHCQERIELLSNELYYARVSEPQSVMQSYVPTSTKKSGAFTFTREDLMHELERELNHSRFMLRLNAVDEEFHRASETAKDHIECVALHGYPTMLWTHDAIKALAREQSRLVARLVALDMTESILEWMLDGWYFGERRSEHKAVGYVPSLKKDGFIKAGFDTVAADPSGDKTEETLLKEKEAEEDRVARFTMPPGVEGSYWNPTTEKVVKPGNTHDLALKETELNIRFGLFYITLMYFRAMHLLRKHSEEGRQLRKPWSLTAKKEQINIGATQTGQMRVKARAKKEYRDILYTFGSYNDQTKRERAATLVLQRIYRGHLGRKAAETWIAHRLEMQALHMLMQCSALTMQRAYRGYRGRARATRVRCRITLFLAKLADEGAVEYKEQLLASDKVANLKHALVKLGKSQQSS